MGLSDINIGNQRVRDELTSEPSVHDIPKVKNDTIRVEMGPISSILDNPGHSFILGSSSNGLLGINTATSDGQQQVLGSAGEITSVLRVLNVADNFIERFTFDNFEDTGSTTADWDNDTAHALDMTSSEVAQSLTIAKDVGRTFTRATLIVEGTGTGNVAYQLSADGGSNFETVTLATQHTFTNTGTDLRFKFTASGNATLTKVSINYI